MLDATMADVRTQWTVAAMRGADVPPLWTVMEDVREQFDDSLEAEPVEYDPEELAVRIAWNLKEA